MRGQVSPRSHERYSEMRRKNVTPLLGAFTLTKLRPEQISSAYAKALTSGRRDGKGGLSARTVTHMHRVLREALQQAVRWQVLARNPADAVKPPKVERGSMHTYDLGQTVELLDSLRGNRMFIPTILAGLCGLRRGEIAALRWRHVDFEAGHISISRAPSRRAPGSATSRPSQVGRAQWQWGAWSPPSYGRIGSRRPRGC